MASNAFLQALQPRSHAERFKRLNEYFQKVYNGQEDFSDWENLRNQLILPMFQGLGDQPPWIGEIREYDEKEALIQLLRPTSPLFKLLLCPTHLKHECYIPLDYLPGGSYHSFQDHGKEYLLTFYQSRITAMGSLKCSIFDYFLINFAAYPTLPVRKVREDRKSSEKRASRRGGGGNSWGTNNLWSGQSPSADNKGSSDPNSPRTTRPRIIDPVLNKSEPYLYLLQLYLDALFSLTLPNSTGSGTPGTGGPAGISTPSKADANNRASAASNLKRCFVNIDRTVETILGPKAHGTLSYEFVSVLVDYWAHQVPSGGSQSFRTPTKLQVTSLQLVVKHVLRGMTFLRDDGYKQHEAIPGPQATLMANEMNHLCKFVLNQAIRKPLFWFLNHSFNFAFWAPESYSILKKSVAVWLDVLAPWSIDADSFVSYIEAKQNKYAPKPAPAFGVASPAGGRSPAPASTPGKPADRISIRPPEWSQSLEKAQRAHVVEIFPLTGRLLSSFLYRAARAPMQYEAWVRMSEWVVDTFGRRPLRSIIYEMEDIVSRRDTDPELTRQSASIKKYLKEVVSMVLNEPIDQHNFPFLRQPVEHPTRRIGELEESTPLSDDPTIRRNVLQVLVRLKRVMAAGAQSASETARTCARVADRTYPHAYRTLFGFTETEVSDAAKADSGGGLHGAESGAVFPETESGTQILTDRGRQQLLSGYKKSSQADAQYYGDARYRPITSDEVAWLVRLLFKISKNLEPRLGYWLDMRQYAQKSFVGTVLFTIMFVVFVFVIWRAS